MGVKLNPKITGLLCACEVLWLESFQLQSLLLKPDVVLVQGYGLLGLALLCTVETVTSLQVPVVVRFVNPPA